MHVSDYKFDATPVLDKPFDEEMVKKQSQEGITVLLSDCLLIDHKSSPESEKTLDNTFFDILEQNAGRQLFVTMLSSNVSRMYQLGVAAVKHGRKIVPSGRTIKTVVEIAKALGYLPFGDDNFVDEEHASSMPQESLVYIIAGCYGQPESALGRLSRGEHKNITLQKGAVVVFSGEPGPPEINVPVGKLTDVLISAGVDVLDGDTTPNLHVSGHGGKDNMIKLAKLANPKYFIPVGGSIRRMRLYKFAMEEIGFNKNSVFELLEGESVEMKGGRCKKGPRLSLNPVYISSGRGEELSPQIIRDRESLSEDGVFAVVFLVDSNNKPIPGKVEIITRGFIYVKESKSLLNKAKDVVTKTIEKDKSKNLDWNGMKNSIERSIKKFLLKETGRHPLILVHILSI